MEPETFDIVIIGAGLSGINSAYRIQKELPHRSYAILESRAEIGGTWSFWKYPGVRTDSSMGLFGFPWRPWPHSTNMADAPDIRAYIEECAAAEGIDKHIRFGHRLVASEWSSAEQRWTLQVDNTREDGSVQRKELKAWWVVSASGYYSYKKPQQAVIPGIENFGGQVVNPQFWDQNINYDGKNVVVIGSGATAVTLLPALAKTAASITMLQRSPSYVLSMPTHDHIIGFLTKILPLPIARFVNWWQRMILETLFVTFLLTFPRAGRKLIVGRMRKELPPGFDVDKHFNPWYNPFEQRLCFCPSGDFFKALARPNARVVTDTIETVTETGIRLKSGETLEADLIVTATGLYFELLSGVSCTVDGESVNESLGKRYIWNGCMLEGVPNTGNIIGYTAATWTPGADVRIRQMIKVMKHLEKKGASSATPHIDPAERKTLKVLPAVGLNSTYVVSAQDRMPKQGGKAPWKNGGSWIEDVWRMITSSVGTGLKLTYAESKKEA